MGAAIFEGKQDDGGNRRPVTGEMRKLEIKGNEHKWKAFVAPNLGEWEKNHLL